MPQEQVVKGLATVAILKTNYDRGGDYIDLFRPFVEDTIAHYSRDSFHTEEMRQAIETRHGLTIPTPALNTILKRISRQKNYLQREGGVYLVALESVPDVDLTEQRKTFDQEHHDVANHFLKSPENAKLELASADDALNLLVSFIADNHIAMILANPDIYMLGERRLTESQQRAMARFVETTLNTGEAYADIIKRMVKGFVLKSALLLSDIRAINRRFEDLTVYLDTGVVFSLLGYHGSPLAAATREAIELMRETGISTRVFDATVDEMKRVLAVYEEHLATKQGRETLRSNRLTRHFLTTHSTPSDVKQIIALLEKKIQDLGLIITVTPPRKRQFTLDETKLAESLRDYRDPTRTPLRDPRVIHDVNCTAAILTMRGSKRPPTLDKGHVVFVSDSATVVRNIGTWYRDMGQPGVPPIIHLTAISNVAWVKRPESASSLPEHELVAACSAVMVPSQEMWSSFISHLKALQVSGEVTDDEAVTIMADELTHTMLATIIEDQAIDATTTREIVERVRQTYKEEGEKRVEVVRAEAEAQLHRVQEEARLARAQRDTTAEASEAIITRLEQKSRTIAQGITTLLKVASLVVVVLGSFLLFPGVIGGFGTQYQIWGYCLAAIVALLAVLNLLQGWHVKQVAEAFEEWLYRRLKEWFI